MSRYWAPEWRCTSCRQPIEPLARSAIMIAPHKPDEHLCAACVDGIFFAAGMALAARLPDEILGE